MLGKYHKKDKSNNKENCRFLELNNNIYSLKDVKLGENKVNAIVRYYNTLREYPVDVESFHQMR